MRRPAAVLAVDGGNSKTDLLLLDHTGALLAARRTGPTSHQKVGLRRAVRTLKRAVTGLARDAGLPPVWPIAPVGVYCLAGLDLAIDDQQVGEALSRAAFTARRVLRNDTFAVLRAGTDAGWGVALVCGAGMNCVAAAPDGRSIRFPALGAISGDGPDGGQWLGLQALRAAVRATDGRGQASALAATVPRHFGLEDPAALTEALYTRRLPRRRLVELAPVVFAAALGGDTVATRLLEELADELVVFGRAALVRLELQAQAVPIVLGGGLFRSGDDRFLDRVRMGLQQVAPSADIRFLTTPPVMGAALLGFDVLQASPAVLATVRALVPDLPDVDEGGNR
ncbi:MAG TPA: BadF/BadG/BcrA/BcrD ATPase family protein [Euzebya sp.]|nr:BadF/BadG/BcrA/BcrD ATPase family protein [Euzebya sp.]